MGPGHAIWALQAVWIWLPGWGLQVCLGWAGSVQAKTSHLACLRLGRKSNRFKATNQEDYEFGRELVFYMIRIAIFIANKTDIQTISNFHEETSKMNIIMRAKRQQQKDEMFYSSRRLIFDNSQLGSQTYQILWFFQPKCEIWVNDKINGIIVPNKSFKWLKRGEELSCILRIIQSMKMIKVSFGTE